MSVYRMNLTDIIEQIRLIIGESDVDLSKITNTQLVNLINAYGTSIPTRINQVAREHGKTFDEGIPKHPMWLTKATISSTGESVVLPEDVFSLQELWLTDYNKFIPWTKNFSRWKTPRDGGLPEKLVITGVDSSGAMTGELVPNPGANLNIRVHYYRVPAKMPGSSYSTEYPDAEAKYHLLWVVGPVTLLMAPDDPAYGEFKRLEQEMLRNLVQEAGARN